MEKDIERKIITILSILQDANKPIGSRIISRELATRGVDLTERAVRYHLRITDEQGLTKIINNRKGRIITEKGKEEVGNALVSDKVGMVIHKVDALSYRTNFDLATQKGDIILNVSFIPKDRFSESLEIMKEVCEAKLTVTDLVVIAQEGEEIGNSIVPENTVALGTVCAVTINGILLSHRVPIYSKFGGIVQVENAETPLRFTEVIYYDGTSLDPAEIFIKSKMTEVLNAARGGLGKVLAGFREFPVACFDVVGEVVAKLEQIGLEGIIAIGKPNQPLLEIPVSTGCVGMVVLAGLNPLAAVEEAGIETDNNALSTMMEFAKLKSLLAL